MPTEYRNITVGGVVIRDCVLMESRYSGFDNLTQTRYQVGSLIAYKHQNKLTAQERRAIFGDGKVYAFTVVWDRTENCPVAQKGGRVPTVRQRRVFSDPNVAARAGARGVVGKIKNPVNFDPSPYQLNILTAHLADKNHIEIKAYAGSGKTTSLVWLVQELCRRHLLPPDVVYLAFNKSIQEELAERLEGTGCPAYTTHAFGYQALKAKFGNGVQSFSGRRAKLWLRILADEQGWAYDADPKSKKSETTFDKVRELPQYELRESVKELCGLIKNWAINPQLLRGQYKFSPTQVQQVLDLIKTYEIEWDVELEVRGQPVDSAMVADYAMKLTVAAIPLNGTLSEVDYDDMLYLPRVLGLRYPKKQLVLTDESQDFNQCQIEMLEVMVEDGARVIFVGDPNQALYHFRGADSQAFTNIGLMLKKHSAVNHCALPKTWRSALRIVQNAQRWVPDFEGERKEWGVVDTISFGQMLGRLNNKQTDIALPDGVDGAMRSLPDEAMKAKKQGCTFGVLCRINLPLFVAAYQCLGMRMKVQIIGKSQIGEPLKRIIWDLCGKPDRSGRLPEDGTNNISDVLNDEQEVVEKGMLSRLADWVNVQSAKLEADGYTKKLEKLQQDVACLEIVAMNVKDNRVSSVIQEIDDLVSDEPDPTAIQFSTIHRAKGLEWNVVFILRPDLLPHPYAVPNEDGSESEDQKVENNCCYVGGTRPKDRLYYVSNWPFGTGANKALAFERPDDGLGCGEEDEADSCEIDMPETRRSRQRGGRVVSKAEAEGGDGGPVGSVLTQDAFRPAQLAPKAKQPQHDSRFTDDGRPF